MSIPVAPNSQVLDFEELNELRLYLETLLRKATASLGLYYVEETGGFTHLRSKKKEPGRFSSTSTATVVAFLTRSGQWSVAGAPWEAMGGPLAKNILGSKFASSGLPEGNPFTTSFLLEAVQDLVDGAGVTLSEESMTVLASRMETLVDALALGNGITVEKYPPTSFMTQKALRVVVRSGLSGERIKPALKAAGDWAWRQLYEESVILSAKRPDGDVFELGYAALTASLATTTLDMTPRQRDAIDYSLNQFFAAQLPDGTWPRSQPLFRYPDYGNAYCYDYEFLVQLLNDKQLDDVLHANLRKLARSAYALDRTKIPLGEAGELGWASGHLKREIAEPESWSSASVYHYCHSLHRVVVEAIRRNLFEYCSSPYSPPAPPRDSNVSIDRSRFLDSRVKRADDREEESLTSLLEEKFLKPILRSAPEVQRGRPLDAPRAAILFGPPGTSKTQLAEIIAEALGWPLLKLDPSHLTRNGIDRLHAETNKVFTMLEAAEQMVVLLDEFDELVRDRDVQGTESASRFLTTAMLPKLTALYARKRIVYLVATNHVERFDPAISRQGRFDIILPVLPPTLDAKFGKWTSVRDHLVSLKVTPRSGAKARIACEQLDDLTFAEFSEIVDPLLKADKQEAVIDIIKDAAQACTMRQELPTQSGGKPETWSDRLKSQRSKIRIPR
jgi:ATPase family associated with various cellular activities (AAA)